MYWDVEDEAAVLSGLWKKKLCRCWQICFGNGLRRPDQEVQRVPALLGF
jgi:hypothetical protein